MKFKITNIEWDTDGENVDLPTEVTYENEDLIVAEDVEDMLSNWLSDTYGWCHNGFTYEEVK